MKVEELIKILSKYDSNLEIVIGREQYHYSVADTSSITADDDDLHQILINEEWMDENNHYADPYFLAIKKENTQWPRQT